MKLRFQLWDSDSANLVGMYESIPEILEDLDRTSTSGEAKDQIRDLVMTLSLGDPDGESITILDGEALYRLGVRRHPLPEDEAPGQSAYDRAEGTSAETRN